jgi:hypothetical protein
MKLQEKNEYITYLIRNEGKYLKELWPNLKKEKSNIRFKLIKEIKLPFEVTTIAKHLEYIDKIKTILFNCYSKIFCLKWPKLIRTFYINIYIQRQQNNYIRLCRLYKIWITRSYRYF